MRRKAKPYRLFATLLLCIMSTAGINVHAQEYDVVSDTLPVDSLANANKRNLERIESPLLLEVPSIVAVSADSATVEPLPKVWVPDPSKAKWLAIVFPGGGQIYNRKFWKLPIVYGGFIGCAYGLNWNNNMYKDYSKAYLDIMDDNPNTNSFLDMLPSGYVYEEDYLKELLRKRKDRYRRYRDMTVFALIGVYLISIVDAYVDAELSNFDISPDLSFRVAPAVINNERYSGNSFSFSGNSFGVRCSLNF